MSTSDALKRRLERILNQRSASSPFPSFASTNNTTPKMTVSSTLTDAPDAASVATATPANPDETLRAVSITDRIKYIHCEGGHGVMTFSSVAGVPMFVKEVSSQEDFKLNYNVFRMMEDLI